MLIAMRSRALKLLIGVIGVVAFGSVLIGVASPDGSVGDVEPVNQGPRPQTATPSAGQTTAPGAPAASADAPTDSPSGADLAPASVAGTWPGRPAAATVTGDTVNWCGAVTTKGAGEAERMFGREAVDAAACAAVSFVLDHRYSRLSLPRSDYRSADFDPILPALDPRTVSGVYRPRIAQFIARHTSNTAGEQLGLVLFTGQGTAAGAEHASAGDGHVFYGPAFTTDGYRDRSVWINPTWSPVTISVDRSSSEPRIRAAFSASASIPVHATSTGRDDMLTVPTRSAFLLRQGNDDTWLINGWTINRGDVSYTQLSVR